MGDELLHCNILKCRRVLGGSRDSCAVATSCSHVFCLDCSNTHFHPDVSRRACPACKTALPNPEEVYVQNLSVSFESRSVFLAALQPALILDMTAKAINFFTYQMTQEAAFQRLLLKKAQDVSHWSLARDWCSSFSLFLCKREPTISQSSMRASSGRPRPRSPLQTTRLLPSSRSWSNSKSICTGSSILGNKLMLYIEQMRNRELKQQQREAHAGYSKLKVSHYTQLDPCTGGLTLVCVSGSNGSDEAPQRPFVCSLCRRSRRNPVGRISFGRPALLQATPCKLLRSLRAPPTELNTSCASVRRAAHSHLNRLNLMPANSGPPLPRARTKKVCQL